MRLIDLSHVVSHGMTTYPGLPGPSISQHMSFEESTGHYAAGTEFSIGTITMVGNTGTYLDTPAHRYRDGHDLSTLPLERCAMLPTVVIRCDEHAIDDAVLDGVDLGGKAVLFHSGWDERWGTAGYGDEDHPHLTAATARRLVDGEAALVGIDSVNIDDTRTGERPIHTILLGGQVPVVEHLTGLGALPAQGAVFSAVPVAVAGLATFAVRAFAAVPDN